MTMRELYQPRRRTRLFRLPLAATGTPSRTNNTFTADASQMTTLSRRRQQNLRNRQTRAITGPIPDQDSNSANLNSSSSNLQRSTDTRIRRSARTAQTAQRSFVPGVCPSTSPLSPGFDFLSPSSSEDSEEDLNTTLVERFRANRQAEKLKEGE